MQVVVAEVCASLTFSEADEVAANPLTAKTLNRTVKLRTIAPSSGHNADIRVGTGACHRPNSTDRAPNRIISTIMIGQFF